MRLLTLPWLRNCFSAFILMSVLSSAITSFAQTTTEQQGVTQNLSECNNSDILSLIGEPIEKLNISPATTPTNSGTNQVSLPQRKVSFSTSQSSNSAPSSTTSQVRNSDSNSTQTNSNVEVSKSGNHNVTFMLQCLDPKIQVLNLFVDGKVVKIPNKNRNFSERMNLKKGRNAIVINSEPPSNVKIQSIEVTPSE